MSGTTKYFIVEASAMPEIYRKVAQAKNLLETGEETTVNAASKAVGISRSAFTSIKMRSDLSTICCRDESSPCRCCSGTNRGPFQGC